MTAAPAPWTRTERTREIGYAQAMLEMSQAAKALKKIYPGPAPDLGPIPPEVAWMMGALAAGRFFDKIAEYASDAFVMYHDPAFFSECVDRLAEGGYGTPPPEPSGVNT